jgi:transcriptional regulator with XRE-family HTH domain
MIKIMQSKDLNRIKIVLIEQKKTAKWLAEEIGKDPSTVSKWCTNSSQPSLDTLSKIADVLSVKLSDLVKN